MSTQTPLYLIALSIGPVQDFIAAARRTRDLWFGSFLLSEISKAAALSLHEQAGDHAQSGLIFPATPQPQKDLQPCDTNLIDGKPPFNVPNKLVAIVQCHNPKATLEQAKQAARSRWVTLAEQLFQRNKAMSLSKHRIDETIWHQQRDELLELFGAWVRYDPAEDHYASKRQRLEQLLAARKNTREFSESQVNGNGIAKSSLDGLRESVIHENRLKPWELRRLGLSAGEQLDCPGLVKRRGGEPEQFRPLSRIAVDPWLRHIKQPLPESVVAAIGELHAADIGLVSKVRGLPDDAFSFDGQLLYSFRIDAERANIAKRPLQLDKPEQQKDITKTLDRLAQHVRPLYKYGEPSPYVAILAADGDRMGELINAAQSQGEHRDISITLSGFAAQVATIADQHYGQLIYAGGDDVLMLVPLDQMLSCAQQLADDFKALLADKAQGQQTAPTLSVGIGISHMLTPMGRQLALAREAEQLAKANQHPDLSQRKNGLAIVYQPRSGERITFREQWSANPVATLKHWEQLHASEELPFGAAFQLREIGRVIDSWCDTGNKLLSQEIRRVMNRKRVETPANADEHNTTGEQHQVSEAGKVNEEIIEAICQRGQHMGLNRLADELVLTQKLAKHTRFIQPSHAD